METKYQNLINYIQEQITDGQLGPGEKVPSENQLAERFHISRQTVRKAIGTLEEEGLVQRIRGSGTYVSFDRRKNLEKRNSIAVVTTYVDSYIFPRILQGMQNTLYESGFSVQIYITNNTLDREKGILKDLLKRDDVAGMIVEGTKSGLPNPNLELYRHLMMRKIPLLFFNTYYPELEVPHVSLNDADTAYKAVRYLIEKGHQKIGGSPETGRRTGQTALFGISACHGGSRAYGDGFPTGVDRHGRIEATGVLPGPASQPGGGMHCSPGVQ